jgi:hypothetical protein
MFDRMRQDIQQENRPGPYAPLTKKTIMCHAHTPRYRTRHRRPKRVACRQTRIPIRVHCSFWLAQRQSVPRQKIRKHSCLRRYARCDSFSDAQMRTLNDSRARVLGTRQIGTAASNHAELSQRFCAEQQGNENARSWRECDKVCQKKVRATRPIKYASSWPSSKDAATKVCA